ncbi:MAG: hypothetical protein ONB23_06655 [candidate division KSB1 bacterium]|nr:hypothetical protein [candidate division KSB1 bacterium]
MEQQPIDALEEKIARLIELVNRLKLENRELRMQNAELLAKLEEDERIIETLRQEQGNAAQHEQELQRLRARDEEVKQRIQELLRKLEQIPLGG